MGVPVVHRQSNGLTVVVEPDRRLPLVAFASSFAAGSAQEPVEQPGLAHLCEHLAFSGRSGAGNAPSGFADHRSGTSSGLVDLDRAAFTTLVPAADWALGLDGERRRFGGGEAGWSEPELAAEAGVLLQEHRERTANGARRQVLGRLFERLFPSDHPYHRPFRAPSPERPTPAGVVEFFARCYGPAAAVLAVVGDIDAGLEREVERRFDGLFGGVGFRHRPPRPAGADREVERLAGSEGRVQAYVACAGPGLGWPGWHATVVLATALATGRSSPLQRELVGRRRIAERVSATLISLASASVTVFSADASPGRTPAAELAGELDEAIDRCLGRAIETREVDRAVTKTLTDHYSRLQRLDDRAAHLARWTQFHGEVEPAVELPHRCRAAGREELELAASGVLDRRRRVRLAVGLEETLR